MSLAAATARVWDADTWSGAGGSAATQFTEQTAVSLRLLADHIGALSDEVGSAADAVAQARTRLQDIIDEFEARASALEADLETPGVAGQLASEARRAMKEATGVVDTLRADLDARTATIADAPRPTAPAAPPGFAGAMPAGAGPSPAHAGFSPAGSGLGTALAGAALGSVRPAARHRASTVGNPAEFGSGAAIRLPDGTTSTAPNPIAASAVRHALTQLGVPYHWGGTAPGVGLDCSGLTQWAYHQAGLDIPRLAQEQDIGMPVDAGSLRPGDLAVWDGHVAMIVSGNQMIEAGDPVQLSAIRTTNAGQGFQGFWRPTA